MSRKAAEKLADLVEAHWLPDPVPACLCRTLMTIPEVWAVLQERREMRKLQMLAATQTVH